MFILIITSNRQWTRLKCDQSSLDTAQEDGKLDISKAAGRYNEVNLKATALPKVSPEYVGKIKASVDSRCRVYELSKLFYSGQCPSVTKILH